MAKELRQQSGKVLIIDDEKVILDLTSIILKNRGYTVFTAVDAPSGFEIIELPSRSWCFLTT